MFKRTVAGSIVVGFLVAASCGDSGDGGGDKGTPDAGEGGDGGTSTTGGSSGTTSTGGRAGSSGSSGTAGTSGGGGESGEPAGGTGGTSGAAGGGGTPDAGEGGDAGTGGGPITCPTVADFPEAWAQHICNKNVDCCGSTEATCRSSAEAGILQLYPALDASVAANQAELNCGDFIACMTAINAASCANWPKELQVDFGIPVNEPRCRTIIRGLIASGPGTGGNACTQNYQCNNGHCTDPDGADPEVRQCIAFRGTGAACLSTANAVGEADDLCNPVTHFCNATDADTPGQCLTRFENGGVCTGPAQCESRQCAASTAQSLCVAPTACEWIPQPPSTCAVRAVGVPGNHLAWLAVSGVLALGAAGRRRRRWR